MKAPVVAAIVLGTALLVSGAAGAQAPGPPAGRVALSGTLRSRVEAWDWFEARQGDGSYTFLGTLLRLSAAGRNRGSDWQVELAAPWLAGLPEDAVAPAPEGPLGLGANYRAANGGKETNLFLKQGFIRLRNAGSPANTLRLGRFEFIEGTEGGPREPTLAALKRDRIAHRLLGNFGWTHVGRSMDGLQFTRDLPRLNVTLLAARPTRGVFDLRGWDELDVDVFYAAATRPFGGSASPGEGRLFWLLYRDDREVVKTDNRPAAARAADPEELQIHTVGGHLLRTLPGKKGTTDLLLWGAAQFGDWGRQEHRAGAAAVEAGYQPRNARLRPWFRAGVNWGSGDRDPDDGDHGTFFAVLPTPRVYARFPFYNAMNTTDLFASVILRPRARWTVRADYHNLRLSRSADLWYQGGGAFQNRPAFGYVGWPSNGRRGLADLFDVSVDYALSPRASLTFYVAYAAGRSVVERIYPEGENGTLVYLEFNQRL